MLLLRLTAVDSTCSLYKCRVAVIDSAPNQTSAEFHGIGGRSGTFVCLDILNSCRNSELFESCGHVPELFSGEFGDSLVSRDLFDRNFSGLIPYVIPQPFSAAQRGFGERQSCVPAVVWSLLSKCSRSLALSQSQYKFVYKSFCERLQASSHLMEG